MASGQRFTLLDLVLSTALGFALASLLLGQRSSDVTSLRAETDLLAHRLAALEGEKQMLLLRQIELPMEYVSGNMSYNFAGSPIARLGGSGAADYTLLYSVALFLVSRCGLVTGIPAVDADIGVLFAPDVQAYQQDGRRLVQQWIQIHQHDFPSSLISITASAGDNVVRVDYGRAFEIFQLEWKAELGSQWPLIHRITGSFAESGAIVPRLLELSPSKLKALDPTSVESLWWAIRFLHADCSQDYVAQASLLTKDAAAFGVIGRHAVVEANRASYAKGIHYTVPYPVTVDAQGKVVLPFNAWGQDERLAYTGTDVYEASANSTLPGQIRRIITIDHSTGACFSAQSCS